MWRMLQHPEPYDFVIATGEAHSVAEFCQRAFARVGLEYKAHVRHDPRYHRPTEVDDLRGDATKARDQLGWEPTVRFDQLVDLMVDADVALLENELAGRTVRVDR